MRTQIKIPKQETEVTALLPAIPAIAWGTVLTWTLVAIASVVASELIENKVFHKDLKEKEAKLRAEQSHKDAEDIKAALASLKEEHKKKMAEFAKKKEALRNKKDHAEEQKKVALKKTGGEDKRTPEQKESDKKKIEAAKAKQAKAKDALKKKTKQVKQLRKQVMQEKKRAASTKDNKMKRKTALKALSASANGTIVLNTQQKEYLLKVAKRTSHQKALKDKYLKRTTKVESTSKLVGDVRSMAAELKDELADF